MFFGPTSSLVIPPPRTYTRTHTPSHLQVIEDAAQLVGRSPQGAVHGSAAPAPCPFARECRWVRVGMCMLRAGRDSRAGRRRTVRLRASARVATVRLSNPNFRWTTTGVVRPMKAADTRTFVYRVHFEQPSGLSQTYLQLLRRPGPAATASCAPGPPWSCRR